MSSASRNCLSASARGASSAGARCVAEIAHGAWERSARRRSNRECSSAVACCPAWIAASTVSGAASTAMVGCAARKRIRHRVRHRVWAGVHIDIEDGAHTISPARMTSVRDGMRLR